MLCCAPAIPCNREPGELMLYLFKGIGSLPLPVNSFDLNGNLNVNPNVLNLINLPVRPADTMNSAEYSNL